MIDRSVPFYKEALALSVDFIIKNSKINSKIIDLGCSTATTLLTIEQHSPHLLNLIGVDNSYDMLTQANKKLKAFNSNIKLLHEDITTTKLDEADAIISNYTLQFINPQSRLKLIKRIYNGLNNKGIFIFSEKVITHHEVLNNQMIDRYYNFKQQQGYSKIEIVKKKEALENVLIPLSEDENKQMLKDAGFRTVEVLFKWINFTTFIAIK